MNVNTPTHADRAWDPSLLATRLREIRERGYSFAVVKAGSMSKPIVDKHGFGT